MKKILLYTLIFISYTSISQTAVPITQFNQYGTSRGGLQMDSAICVPMKDTVNPFVHFSNMRKVGRVYFRPQDFRGYIHDGIKWRPLNTFTASLESKLNGISPGATVNQTDAFLKDRSNHTGVQSYTTITGLSTVSHTGNYIDLFGRPDLSVFMQYADTMSMNNRMNLKLNKSDTMSLSNRINSKLSVEVDGSVTNEIELPSQTGQSGKILSTNGSVPSWITPTNNTYTAGTGINVSVGNIISNTAPDQTVTITGGNRISVTGTYPNFTISYIEPSINIVSSKTLNSNFTVSTTKQANVSYSLTCTVTNPLLAGSSTANIYLEYSTNGGSTWLLPSQNGNASTVGVAVAIAITNGQTVTVTGSIPANALVRLRTATTGTASVTYVTGTEIY